MWLSHTQTWGTGLHEWSVTRREDYGCSVAELSSEGYSKGGITTPPLTFFGRLCHTFCGILVSRPENERGHPGLEIQSPNPWTTREFLLLLLLSICLCEWLGTELQLWVLPWHSLGTGLWGNSLYVDGCSVQALCQGTEFDIRRHPGPGDGKSLWKKPALKTIAGNERATSLLFS